MRLYPNVASRFVATAAYDALLLLLLAVFAYVGLKVHDAIDGLSVLGEGVRKAGDTIPLGVGDPISDLGRSGEDRVHHLANVLGLVTFALPATLAIWHFLPRRLAQIKRLTVAARVVEGAPARELAMRAAFSLPYAQLLAWTDDPLGDLASQRYDRLVAAVLDDAGVKPSS
jgi:hypothetical protein